MIEMNYRQRRLNRLKDYDYSQSGWYFVTICVKDRRCIFGEITDSTTMLNRYGEIIQVIWQNIPCHYDGVSLDECIIMPNHIHGIIIIENDDNSIEKTEQCYIAENYGLLSKIIKSFKGICVKTIRSQFGDYDFGFQRSFYDHIIRSEKSLNAIRQYIIYNPLKWSTDELNPKSTRQL